MENNNQQKHYICLGGCKGVAINEGVCQDQNCADYNKALVECNCDDQKHNESVSQDDKVGA